MDKETLQNKIENGDTVWAFSWATGEKRIVELNLQENEPETDNYLLYFWDKDLVEHRYGLESIFATKEEAEWQVEFGNITRTEKLELPTWDEIDVSNGDTVICLFNTKGGTECILSVNDFGDDDFYDWTILLEKQGKEYQDFDFTRNGYLEACRFCKKLFLGDEL